MPLHGRGADEFGIVLAAFTGRESGIASDFSKEDGMRARIAGLIGDKIAGFATGLFGACVNPFPWK